MITLNHETNSLREAFLRTQEEHNEVERLMDDVGENFGYIDVAYSEIFEETWNLGEERKLEPRVVLYAIALLMQNVGIETSRDYLLANPRSLEDMGSDWTVPYEKRDKNRPDRLQ